MPSEDLLINFYKLYNTGWNKYILQVEGIHTYTLSFFKKQNKTKPVNKPMNVLQMSSTFIQRKEEEFCVSAQPPHDKVHVGSDPLDPSARGTDSKLSILAEFLFGCCHSASWNPEDLARSSCTQFFKGLSWFLQFFLCISKQHQSMVAFLHLCLDMYD